MAVQPFTAHLQNWRLDLSNMLRELWEQHIVWTRSFIISRIHNLGDLEQVTQRLLRNPQDFALALRQFYGPDTAAEFSRLLTDHLLIAAELVEAGITGAPAAEIQARFYDNGDEIAAFLATINPYWNEELWRGMFYHHLGLVEEEAGLRLSRDYAADVALYDEIEDQALGMADVMAEGIIRQFNL